MVLSGATTPGQSRPESDGNDRVLRIPQSSSITGASPSNFFVSYPGYLLEGGGITPLQRCSWCIQQLQPTGLWNYLTQNCGIRRLIIFPKIVSEVGQRLCWCVRFEENIFSLEQLICLAAYQLLMGYLMSKFYSFINVLL